jgi:hypothetical protein
MSNMCWRDYYASMLGTILALSDLQPIFFAGRQPNKNLGTWEPPSNHVPYRLTTNITALEGDSSKKGPRLNSSKASFLQFF